MDSQNWLPSYIRYEQIIIIGHECALQYESQAVIDEMVSVGVPQ